MTRYGLCIGINYTNTPNELKFCIHDAKTIKECFKYFFGIQDKHCIHLTDDQETHKQPTYDNIIHWIQNITSKCKNKDELLIYYSGHGYYIHNIHSEERDKRDEILCPLDCMDNIKQLKYIKDDIFLQLLNSTQEKGVKIIVITDACHSGTVCDLPYVYNGITMDTEYMSHNIKLNNRIFSISSCKDTQQSFEHRQQNHGVMTHSFISWLQTQLQQARTYIQKHKSFFKSQTKPYIIKQYTIEQLHQSIRIQGKQRKLFPQDLIISSSNPCDIENHCLKLEFIPQQNKLQFSFII